MSKGAINFCCDLCEAILFYPYYDRPIDLALGSSEYGHSYTGGQQDLNPYE